MKLKKHKHVKNIALYIAVFTFLILPSFYSCEGLMGDFLDKAPGIDVTEDTIFSSVTQVETFLASIYQYGIHSNLPYYWDGGDGDYRYANPSGALSAGATDEAETCAPWYWTNTWNSGGLNSNSNEEIRDARFPHRWTAIRKVTVMIDRVHDVPGITPAYAAQLEAEAKVIRAMNYLEMLKRYGGMPIIDHRLTLEEDHKIPRGTVDEVVRFIEKDCDEALSALPDNQTGNLKGRIHKGVALAVKAKTLLFAASPLFNTATPYLSLGENNNLICYGNYDRARWEAAAAASKAVLDWAKTAGCELITEEGADKNYHYTWDMYDNKEIILAEKSQTGRGRWSWPWSVISAPTIYPGNSGQSGTTPTLNFVRKYEKTDGTPQIWEPNGGENLQAKMGELDRRFAQTIAYNWGKFDETHPRLEMHQADAANDIRAGVNENTCYGGFWLRKHYPSALDETAGGTYRIKPNSTIFQLNEFYLSYAEAMNEAYGPDNNNGYELTARQALNIIRNRSGQPNATEADITERIRNERTIELAFDDHRLYDVRRWMIADQEGVMQGSIWGIKIYKIPGNDTECRYEPYVFETRTWVRRMYLNPLSQNEINKGYLVQNPGY